MATIVTVLLAILTALQIPARDANGPAARAGAGVIEGRVVLAEDPMHAARRVVVTLTAAELAAGRPTITDDDGRFAFANLPAGRFTIQGRRPAFLTAAYGAKKAGGAGTPLALAAGQRVAGITLSLVRGAALGGSIRDPAGDPAGGVSVFAVKTAALASQGAAPPSAAVVTDDRGAYRLFGLDPGEYVVMAFVRPSGGGADIDVATTARVDALLAALERGPVRGDAPVWPPTTPSQPNGTGSVAPLRTAYAFAPVYYPGSVLPADAGRLVLRPGDDRNGMDFAQSLTPVVSIEGAVVGARENTDVQVAIATDGPKLQSWVVATPTLAIRPGADGRFKYTGVTPGHYAIMARTTVRGQASSGNALPPLLSTSDQTQWAQADLDVNGADVSGLSLELQPALRFAGRIQFDAAGPPPSFDFAKVRVGLASRTGGISVTNGQIGGRLTVLPVSARSDGTFDLVGVTPGDYSITCSVAGGPEWSLISAVVDARDLLDAPVRFTPASGSVSGAVLTMSNRHSELSGDLLLPPGTSVADYTVIVFPAARELWAASRRIAMARPATDGRFMFRDLPAGEYALAALTGVTGDETDMLPLFDQALPASVKVTLASGEHKTQSLRVVAR